MAFRDLQDQIDALTRKLSNYLTTLPTASATAKGIVELATNAEAQAGTDAERAVTPAALQAKSATQAEVNTGTATNRFVTPATMRNADGQPWAMAAGQTSFTMSGTAVVGITVTLPTGRFTQAPYPYANLFTGVGGSQLDVVRAYGSTSTSVTIGIWTGNATSAGSHTAIVNWLAVQMTSGSAAG